jgi:hypothetical protein
MTALDLATIRRRALASLIPPPRLPLSTWIEANVRLPEGVSALPGPARLWQLSMRHRRWALSSVREVSRPELVAVTVRRALVRDLALALPSCAGRIEALTGSLWLAPQAGRRDSAARARRGSPAGAAPSAWSGHRRALRDGVAGPGRRCASWRFTRPQNRVCFQNARLESLTLQAVEITIARQFGWSEAKSGTARAGGRAVPAFRFAPCGLPRTPCVYHLPSRSISAIAAAGARTLPSWIT